MGSIVVERAGINLYSEYSLHAQLKEYLARPGDCLEAPIEGKVIDLVRADGELVEVQTGHLGQIESKVLEFAGKGYRVRVVYPVSAVRELRRLDPVTHELLSTRRSPKHGDIYSLFDELVHAPEFVAAQNVAVEVIMIRSVETKMRDGSGSWWRKGDRTVDRELVEVLSSCSFQTPREWLSFIPENLEPPWSSVVLGEVLGIGPERARKILYCFSRSGLLVESEKNGRGKTYRKA